jgi:hypothetical protein
MNWQFLKRTKMAIFALLFCTLSSFAVVRDLWKGHTRATELSRLLSDQASISKSIEWLPDDPKVSPAVEPKTRVLLTNIYALAWASIDDGQVGEQLKQSLSGPALTQAWSDLNDREDSRAIVHNRHLRHVLRVTYYSEDRSIVAIEAPEILREQTITGGSATKQDGLSSTTTERRSDAFRFVMRQHDGEWRVEMIQKGGAS